MSLLRVTRVGPGTSTKPTVVMFPIDGIGAIHPTKVTNPDGPATIRLRKEWCTVFQYDSLEIAESVADIAAALEALGEEIVVVADARVRRAVEIDGLS